MVTLLLKVLVKHGLTKEGEGTVSWEGLFDDRPISKSSPHVPFWWLCPDRTVGGDRGTGGRFKCLPPCQAGRCSSLKHT